MPRLSKPRLKKDASTPAQPRSPQAKGWVRELHNRRRPTTTPNQLEQDVDDVESSSDVEVLPQALSSAVEVAPNNTSPTLSYVESSALSADRFRTHIISHKSSPPSITFSGSERANLTTSRVNFWPGETLIQQNHPSNGLLLGLTTPQHLVISSRPERADIFRDFQRRYPIPQSSRGTPTLKRKRAGSLASEVKRRRGLASSKKEIDLPMLKESDAPAAVTTAAPPYEGRVQPFIFACAYLVGLVKANDTALHQSLWDDFVRFYTSQWMPRFKAWNKAEEEDNCRECPDSFLDHYKTDRTDSVMEPPLSMYCTQIRRPLYSGCVLFPQSLQEALCQHPETAAKATAWILASKSMFAKEGLPYKRSSLWN